MPAQLIALGLTLQIGAYIWGIFDIYPSLAEWWKVVMEQPIPAKIVVALFFISVVVQGAYLAGVRGGKVWGYLMSVYMVYIVGYRGY